jgi:subtilisin family serine protease
MLGNCLCRAFWTMQRFRKSVRLRWLCAAVSGTAPGWWLVAAVFCLGCGGPVLAGPVTPAMRAQLARGEPLDVIVEVDRRAADAAALAERTRRRLTREDEPILQERARLYLLLKGGVVASAGGGDANPVQDYDRLPLVAWRIRSLAALARLEQQTSVARVHAVPVLKPNGVSDLGFIQQPAAAAAGATGAGTTIAVVDGGLGNNFTLYQDFGPCTAVGQPAASCRVAYNHVYFPGQSAATGHGTNVSAISLGVAPGARLAMFDVFSGSTASGMTVLSALNTILSIRAQYNIVAVNLSLGAGTLNTASCPSSAFAAAFAQLTAAGVQPVVAAGNSGAKNGLDDPACVPGAVSVGAVYDQNYGVRGWVASAAPGGTCYDTSAPDAVTCFSQSAAYLTILAPGTFVSAPDASFQQSGTSQATPHVSGVIALLRARYPAETLTQTVSRLKLGASTLVDPANLQSTPRLNAYAAVSLGTAVSLNGSGPVTAMGGTSAVFTLAASNAGPLAATNLQVKFPLPANATLSTASAGCALASGVVTCGAATLAVNAIAQWAITLLWTASGPVNVSATVTADQANSAAQQTAYFGASGSVSSGDAPLPPWAWAALGVLLSGIARHRIRGRGAMPGPYWFST